MSKVGDKGASGKELTPWTGLPSKIDLDGYAGFVYLIEEVSSGKLYVGRKYFWSNRKKKIKGKKRRVRVTSESDWQYYKSSSKELKALILCKGVEAFNFTILSLHKTRAATNYAEVKEMFLKDVLYARMPNGDYRYMNQCILNRYYRSKV